MKVLIQIVLCSTLLLGGAMAQHRGGGGGGGGFHGSVGGSSHMGGGGFSSMGHGGFVGGGSGFRGGVGIGRGIGYGGYYGGYGYGWGYPDYGFGFGYGYPYYYSGIDYPYGYGYDPYAYPAYQTYPAYNPSQNVTVVYPPAQQSYGATSQMRQYDQYGQQIRPSTQAAPTDGDGSSPIYLIAMKNHNIVAASSYSITGNTLHYFTLEHVEQQVALDAVDRDLTQRLNQERRVPVQFQQQQQ